MRGGGAIARSLKDLVPADNNLPIGVVLEWSGRGWEREEAERAAAAAAQMRPRRAATSRRKERRARGAVDSNFSSSDEEFSSPRFIDRKASGKLAEIFSSTSFESSADSFISSDSSVTLQLHRPSAAIGKGPIFARSFQKTEEITKWGHEAARGGRRGPRPWPRRPAPWAPRVAPALTLRLLKASVAKPPREPRYGKPYFRAAAANPISGDSEIASGTLPERGFISRRTLHRHGRLRSDE
ncbi:hypothetical protein QYE76_065190 [Lolium multiflorum]|uniref:Uncharacterized protein n=1 Tax=Lolium multiflorum TaxID=4521 RepID=A0AAD8SAF6_LOLMU|nr:hypothetical protein QYE76_065190 [Lolium multiflorum]